MVGAEKIEPPAGPDELLAARAGDWRGRRAHGVGAPEQPAAAGIDGDQAAAEACSSGTSGPRPRLPRTSSPAHTARPRTAGGFRRGARSGARRARCAHSALAVTAHRWRAACPCHRRTRRRGGPVIGGRASAVNCLDDDAGAHQRARVVAPVACSRCRHRAQTRARPCRRRAPGRRPPPADRRRRGRGRQRSSAASDCGTCAAVKPGSGWKRELARSRPQLRQSPAEGAGAAAARQGLASAAARGAGLLAGEIDGDGCGSVLGAQARRLRAHHPEGEGVDDILGGARDADQHFRRDRGPRRGRDRRRSGWRTAPPLPGGRLRRESAEGWMRARVRA